MGKVTQINAFWHPGARRGLRCTLFGAKVPFFGGVNLGALGPFGQKVCTVGPKRGLPPFFGGIAFWPFGPKGEGRSLVLSH